MTDTTHAKIPHHLRRYVIDQNYSRYTPEDQAVWRFIMRQLKDFLSRHAHEAYIDGLKKTGLSVERIPSIDEIDEHLEEFGWGAVPVSGFIPPAAFMELQSLGILPIASDMRSLNHLTYTPAPDIVHEAAGHAPILIHPEYAAYLRQYGDVAKHAIISKSDMDQYEAIRILSDIKEDPRSSRVEIERAERRLHEITSEMTDASEAALLSRMNWWTAEYGLIGDLENPRIFGAGLLSSVGESRTCLESRVKKIRLSIECIEYSYDITEPQPQLFVAHNFAQLKAVLDELAQKLAYKRGGLFGLRRAIEALTVNTVQFNSGVQISGVLKEYLVDPKEHDLPAYVVFAGPTQLALSGQEITDQGPSRHIHGYSTPVGMLANQTRCLSTFSRSDLEKINLRPGQRGKLLFKSGVRVEGLLKTQCYNEGTLTILTWTDCKVTLGDRLLFDPAWGEYDMAVGSQVTSVFGGPADRSRFGQTKDFVAQRVPARAFSSEQRKRHNFFQKIRDLRENPSVKDPQRRFDELANEFTLMDPEEWLPGMELLELSLMLGLGERRRSELLARLQPDQFQSTIVRQSVADGLALAHKKL